MSDRPVEDASQEDDVRWLALLLRQAFLLVVRDIERRYQVGEFKGGPAPPEKGRRAA